MPNDTQTTQGIQEQTISPHTPHTFSAWDIVSTIGIVAIFSAFLYIGRKLQVLDDLKITTEKIKINLKIVSDFLIENNETFNSKELQIYSPLNLSPEGERFIKEMGFDTVFAQHKKDFVDAIDVENPKLKYDVELAAIKSIYNLTDQPYMNFLKAFLYNNPERNLANTAPTLGVYIRDKYLEEHPEITE